MLRTLAAVATIATGFFASHSAQAVPAFARQMNAECSTCHYQHFAKLNAFGRSFKASGYSMTARPTLEGKDLSIAENLNATFFLRSQYVDRSADEETGDKLDRASWAVPNEAAILIGGRLTEGVGGMVEWGGPLLGAKMSFSKDMGNGITVGTTLFTTDALGAGYGYDGSNTGAVRNQRPSERSSRPTLGNNSNLELAGAATGLAFYASNPNWFANISLYAPDSNEAGITEMDAGTKLSHYARGMVFLNTAGGWEIGVGAGLYSGSTTATTNYDHDQVDVNGDLVLDSNGDPIPEDLFNLTPGENEIVTRAKFVDAQLQGTAGGRELGVYFMYAQGEEPNATDGKAHLYAGVDKKPKGWGLDAEYFVADKLAVLASLGSHDNGTDGQSAKKSAGVGLYWKIAQNITLQPMYEKFSGEQGQDANGDDVTQFTVTLEAAF
jgi:hypothetical protein